MAPHAEKMKMMRIVVREDFSKSRCDALITDFKLALQTLDAMDAKKLQEHKEYVFDFGRCPQNPPTYLFRSVLSLFGVKE